MSSVFETVFADIKQRIKDDTLTLPTLPEVAFQIRETAENEDSTVNDIVRVLQKDPAVCAELVRCANSALMRTVNQCRDVSGAVNRMGMNTTVNIAMTQAMKQMFQATSDTVDTRMRETWNRAVEVAAMCFVLAQTRRKLGLKPDQAALAGLMHNIGALPVLLYAEENSDLINDSFALDKTIEKLHPILGKYLLQKWNFTLDLIAVPYQYLQFDREGSFADYVDLVQVSYLHTLSGTNHPHAKIDLSTVGAFQRLDIDPMTFIKQDEKTEAQLQEAKDMLG
ncbi:HDOD domain-containing protein [Litoribrevibacter albus]|uniref:HDOD domain-containing protein n=1 Tax=Litoribrevibacter albus TaxID=1473156 RepID=A0AA37S6H4_9GAMM|nr:HDOD domain-containing protein [Litoribrevibacter albus]GLQ29797.1 HDOD domain-containing protein [Litoribrevibacter albus]